MANPFVFLILLLVFPAVSAVIHVVGNNNGWTTGVNYNAWAASQNFVVGDTLLFNYDPNAHAVNEVTQPDYQFCISPNPISTSSITPTTILLSTPGTRYFISPRSTDCIQGMKLAVTVGGYGGGFLAPPPPPPFGTFPFPFGLPGQSGPPLPFLPGQFSPPPPPPPYFRGGQFRPSPPLFLSSACSFSDWKNKILMIGSSFVLTAFLGVFMV